MAWKVLLGILAIGLLIPAYRNGLVVAQKKVALFYVEKNRGLSARFRACHGTMRRVLPFRERGMIEGVLYAELTAGTVTISILDRKKQPVVLLTPEIPVAQCELAKGKSYYLRVDFEHAQGTYEVKLTKVSE